MDCRSYFFDSSRCFCDRHKRYGFAHLPLKIQCLQAAADAQGLSRKLFMYMAEAPNADGKREVRLDSPLRSVTWKGRVRRLGIVLSVLGALAAMAWLERAPLLRGAANIWIVSDEPTHADSVVVLGERKSTTGPSSQPTCTTEASPIRCWFRV